MSFVLGVVLDACLKLHAAPCVRENPYKLRFRLSSSWDVRAPGGWAPWRGHAGVT